MRAHRFIVAVALLVAPASARAALNQVQLGDLPNTDGKWQQGEVTVAATPEQVTAWFDDVKNWPRIFPDDEWVHDFGTGPDGRRVATFRSKVLGKTLTVRMRKQPGLFTYDGSGKGIATQGKIFILPARPGETRIIMQTTGELHGLTGAIAPQSLKRKRALEKLGSDLHALVNVSLTERERMPVSGGGQAPPRP